VNLGDAEGEAVPIPIHRKLKNELQESHYEPAVNLGDAEGEAVHTPLHRKLKNKL
jgi:hypothetical protein